MTLLSVFIAICGAVVTMTSPSPPNASARGDAQYAEPSPSLVGDLLAFAVSIGGVFFFSSTKELRKRNWDVLAIYCANQLFLLAITFAFVWAGIAIQNTPTWDRHPIHGIWGWTNASNAPLLIFTALYCDIVGIMGYMAVLKYFDPLVITVVSLLEPLISIVIGCILGMAPVPGLGTWIGGTMMIVGAFGVTDTGETKETVDATDAILASPSRPPPKDRMTRLTRFDRGIEMQTLCISPSRDDPPFFSECPAAATAASSCSDNNIGIGKTSPPGTSCGDASDRHMALRPESMASGDLFQGDSVDMHEESHHRIGRSRAHHIGKVPNSSKKRKKRGHDVKARVLNHT